jgi:cell wall-associated NlpC family hydrolase
VTALDRRLLPARPDLAAEHLRGRVEAARFVVGEARRVVDFAAPVRREPRPDAPLDTEALHGEAVTVYDEVEGWAWGQLARDLYVGWLPANALGKPLPATHRVGALRTFVYPAPSIKQPPLQPLSFGSEVAVAAQEGHFARLAEGGFVFERHLQPVGTIEADPVAVAERFLGVPYLWGGRTSLGLDCSALVQTALEAAGRACPRDSDMQEHELGEPLAGGLAALRRGDLLFWKGHVAMARDAATMIHATAWTMSVIIEPIAEAVARIAAGGDPLRGVRRLR